MEARTMGLANNLTILSRDFGAQVRQGCETGTYIIYCVEIYHKGAGLDHVNRMEKRTIRQYLDEGS